jgi:hypothetical protein
MARAGVLTMTDAERMTAIFDRLGKIDRDLIVQGIA